MRPAEIIYRMFKLLQRIQDGDEVLEYIDDNRPGPGEDLVIPAHLVPDFYRTLKPAIRVARKYDFNQDEE